MDKITKKLLNFGSLLIAIGLLIYSTEVVSPIPYYLFCGLLGWSWNTIN